jgi:hypothetical protein
VVKLLVEGGLAVALINKSDCKEEKANTQQEDERQKASCFCKSGSLCYDGQR